MPLLTFMAAFTLVEFIDSNLGVHWLMNQDMPFEQNAFVKSTPKVPGVYRMINSQQKVMYVGKAKVLPNRFSSYFEGNSHRPDMEGRIANMQTVYVFKDHEAMELEYNIYLKYYLPYYNKTSPENSMYLYLTPEDQYQSIGPQGVWRRDILFQMQETGKNITFIGPFTATRVHKDIINEFQMTFGIPSCTPAKFKRHQKEGFSCEEHEFGRCKGWCVKSTPAQYEKFWIPIKNIFLSGEGSEELLETYKEQMPNTYKYIKTRSILDSLDVQEEYDLLYLHQDGANIGMSIIEVSKGQVIDIRNMSAAKADDTLICDPRATIPFLAGLNRTQLYQGFLENYYHIVRDESYLADNSMIDHSPKKIVVINSGFTPQQAKDLSQNLSKIFGYKVRLHAKAPRRGVLELAKYNALNNLEQRKNLLELNEYVQRQRASFERKRGAQRLPKQRKTGRKDIDKHEV